MNNNEGQLELFSEFRLGAAHLSRIIPVWDLLGIFLLGRQNEIPPNTPAAEIKPRRHEFPQRNERITFEVRPAMLSKASEKTRMIFAGEREQLVAAAIRALAVRGDARIGVQPGKKLARHVTVAFTVRQLRAELQATNHTFSHSEIMEALEVLGKTSVTITRAREGEQPIVDEFAFYTNHMAQGDKRIVVLNSLESQLILDGAYRSLNYTRLMSLDDPLARWLYQYIHAEHRGARKPEFGQERTPFYFTLDQLFERGVLNRTKELRKSIQRVRNMLDRLCKAKVLDTGDEGEPRAGYVEELSHEPTGGRRKITGARWGVFLSARDVDEIIDENAEAKYRGGPYDSYTPEQRIKLTTTARENLKRRKAS